MALTITSSDPNESNFLMIEGKRVDKSQTVGRLRGDGCWDGDVKYFSKNYGPKGIYIYIFWWSINFIT